MATTSDPQSLLSASFQVPSMLMTYLTAAGVTTTPAASDTANSDAESATTHAIESKHQDRKQSNTTPPPNNRRHRSLLLPSPTRSLPLDESENMYASGDFSREGSVMSSNGRSAKRLSKPKTSYSICQPAPKGHTLQKIQVRARPLLQLHKLNAGSRPTPAFELLPSAIFSSSLTRAIGKKYRARHGLCPADLAVVKADSYHQHEESGAEEDESRDVLALICKGRWRDNLAPGRARIFLEDGADYEAYALPNGGYEFTSTDHHGLTTTVRWVLKRPRMRRSRSSMTDMDLPVADPLSKRFSFSTILPNSRRHPIIANLTSTTIDIQDIYNMPNPSPSSKLSPSAPPSPDEGDVLKGEPVETTPALRTLITVTALWVSIREGWSPGYRYDDFISRSSSTKINRSPNKAAGDSLDAGRDDHRRRSASIVRMFKGGAHKRQSVQSASAATDGSDEDYVMSRNSSLRSVRRSRAESSATVIHRTPFPRHEIIITPRYTTGSASTHDLDHEDDVTEDEEEDDDDGKAQVVQHTVNASTTPRNQSPPNSTAPPALRLIDASDESRPSTPPTIDLDDKLPPPTKRTDSAANMTTEPHHKLEVKPEEKPKRGRIMRVLLCGLS